MPLLNLGNRRAQGAGNDGEIGKLDYRIGNPNVGQGVYLTGAERYIPVEGKTLTQTVQLGTTTTAYTAGDAVGGKFILPMARTPGGGGTINTVVLIEGTTQAAAATLWVFRQDFTATVDNAAFAPSDADMFNCIGFIPIVSYPTTAPSNNQVGTARGVGLTYQCGESDGNLYFQLQTNGTPTYALSNVMLTISTILE